jgi:ureidoglycolate lyase
MKHDTVKVQPVTAEAFAKYGEIIPLIPNQKPLDDNENLTAWVDVVMFSPDEGRGEILLRLKNRPMVLTVMERHIRTTEWWTNVEGEMVGTFAEAVDPDNPNEKPNPAKIVAFKMTGVAGYLVKRGVWHWPSFPIGETATQFVNVRLGTVDDDVEKIDLPYPIKIEL